MAEFLRPRFDRLDLLIMGRSDISKLNQDWDAVFGAMEASVPFSYFVSQKLQLPIYSHWEWLPPFRLFGYNGGENPLQWGLREEHVASHYQNKGYYNKYNQIIKSAIASNISSCAGNICKEIAVKFSEDPIENCFIKYPSSPMPVDKDRNRIKEDYFITVSRLVPNKRVAEIAESVRLADLETTWVIVGDGPEKEIIREILKNSKTKLAFYSNTNGQKKFELLSKAKFQVSAWHGLPQLEASLVGTATINLEIPYIRELYGDSLIWAKNINKMSEKIRYFYGSSSKCREASNTLYEQATTNQLNINTLNQGADIIESKLRGLI